MRFQRTVLAALAATVAGCASTDVVLRHAAEDDGKPYSATFISGDRVRVERLQGAPDYVLWRRGEDRFLIVNRETRSYYVFDGARMQEASVAMQRALSALEDQLESMPPEARQKLREMFPNLGRGMPLFEVQVTKSGRGHKVGRDCGLVEVVIFGIPGQQASGQEYCVVPGEALGLPGASLDTLRAMARETAAITERIAVLGMRMPDEAALGGMPIWSRDKRTGKAWVFQEVSKGRLDPSCSRCRRDSPSGRPRGSPLSTRSLPSRTTKIERG